MSRARATHGELRGGGNTLNAIENLSHAHRRRKKPSTLSAVMKAAVWPSITLACGVAALILIGLPLSDIKESMCAEQDGDPRLSRYCD